MTRKAIVLSVAAIALSGLIAAARHCLRTMARSGDHGAPVELRAGRPRCRRDSSQQAAPTTAAAA
jgi:hypothetical protein